MATRTPFVGGNWKMNTNLATATTLAQEVASRCADSAHTSQVVIFPPFPYLAAVRNQLKSAADAGQVAPIHLGAQNFFPEPDGAFTGEVSLAMLADLGVQFVLIGHSERRHVIGEDDDLISRKVRAALDYQPSPQAEPFRIVLCVGETLQQREAGQTETVVLNQVRTGLQGVAPADLDRIVIAYEPVWAIGTGRTASPEDAQTVHSAIRNAVASDYDGTMADSLRIVYGGSVKAANAETLFAQPDIDGGLIGGASLDAEEFAAIVRASAATVTTHSAH